MTHYRSIWISDVHLGTRGCSSKELLAFLKHTESDNLFLVGDIVDMWQLRKKWYWPRQHNDIIQKILRKSRKGTRVVYIPGNHDETIREFLPLMMGDIEVSYEFDYYSAKGDRYLVTHGDLYDIVTQYHKWLARLGDAGYVALIEVNRYLNWFRRKFNMGYWSLSNFVKRKVKNAASFINNYEESLAQTCKRGQYHGVIAGHIHHAEMREINGVRYMNDGDWVESKTALAECDDGTFVLLAWQGDNLVETSSWSPGKTPTIHANPHILVTEQIV